MTISGTSGNDNLTGTSGADEFDLSQGGNDTVSGLEASDTFLFGAELTKRDTIDGGLGQNDNVVLDGNYSSGLKFRAQTLTGIEILTFGAGHNYDITLVEDNFSPALMTGTIDASALGASDRFTLDAHRETTTHLTISAGAGDDVIIGGDSGNTINLDAGGADNATGGTNADTFFMGAAFDDLDQLFGGGGSDQVTLVGDYSAGLTITKDMAHDIERLYLSGAGDYDITLKSKVSAAGDAFTVSTFGVVGGFDIVVDARDDTDSTFQFYGGSANETYVGTDGNDTFLVGAGADRAEGRHGDDIFNVQNGFTADDVLMGGVGQDTLIVSTHDFEAGVTLGPDTLDSVEAIVFGYAFSYWLIMDDGNVTGGDTLLVDGTEIIEAETLTFDGSAEVDGAFFMIGGSGDDTLTGGNGADTIDGSAGKDILHGGPGDDVLTGGLGSDRFDGGLGSDHYVINHVGESTGVNFDRTVTFDTLHDAFDLSTPVTGIDAAVTTGGLSVASFDSDLVGAIGAAELAVTHAVLFRPDSGDLAGHRFLVIEFGGGAGYQAGVDYVVLVDHMAHVLQLSNNNFI